MVGESLYALGCCVFEETWTHGEKQSSEESTGEDLDLLGTVRVKPKALDM